MLKKYLELNARIIGFNVDPEFNNCLDGLIMVDVRDIPAEFVHSLSREQDDDSVRERFRGKE